MIYFLIGYMGCGKSTIGKKISEKYGMPFIDTDEVIELAEDLSINDIFDIKGENYFRDAESKVLDEIINDNTNVIVSCGGGLPIYNDNMEKMNKSGITIYIKCTPETILSRLTIEEINKRPLLKDKTSMELLDIIKTNIENREKIYNKAGVIINYENINFEWP